ncbi:MAG: hypothetical protein KGD70_14115 [Candidatus Lokiarchaeota archaeon]|nr:hypothetical protein [Candidatus Lokiarchaeota archaeon]
MSETLSITVPLSSSPTSSPSITPTPDQTTEPTPKPIQTIQFEAILGITFVLAVFGVGLGFLVYLIKRNLQV